MAKFDLAAKLKEAASNLNTPGAEQIEYLPFELLDPDPDNFYSIDGLNELADSIATVGILTPLRVRANGGRYTITSGHRRRAAVQLLIDSGEDWSSEDVDKEVTAIRAEQSEEARASVRDDGGFEDDETAEDADALMPKEDDDEQPAR